MDAPDGQCDEIVSAEKILVEAGGTCGEAKITSILTDKKTSDKAKKTKLETAFNSMSSQGRTYGGNLDGLIHPLLLKEATALVLRKN